MLMMFKRVDINNKKDLNLIPKVFVTSDNHHKTSSKYFCCHERAEWLMNLAILKTTPQRLLFLCVTMLSFTALTWIYVVFFFTRALFILPYFTLNNYLFSDFFLYVRNVSLKWIKNRKRNWKHPFIYHKQPNRL